MDIYWPSRLSLSKRADRKTVEAIADIVRAGSVQLRSDRRRGAIDSAIPADQSRGADHKGKPGCVHRELRREAVVPFGENEVAQHREHNAEAEDLKRMLAAPVDRLRYSPGQKSGVGRHEADHDDR